MGRSYSMDMRLRVSEAVAKGLSRRGAARRFAVSESSAIRWALRALRDGSPSPRRQGRPPGRGPLSAQLAYLTAQIEASPDLTMPELAQRLAAERGVRADPASLSRLLCRAGFTYKKTADGVGVRTR
jgi:transposase